MNNRPLSVLHLAPVLQSGAGRVITGLARDSRAHGIEACVASTGSGAAHTDWPEYRRLLQEAEIPCYDINFFSRDEQQISESVTILSHLLRSAHFDLLHAHAGVPAAAAQAAMELAGRPAPLITTFYSWGIGRPDWMDQQDLAAFAASDRLTVGTSWYRQFLVERGIPASNITIIPWGIDESCFAVQPDPAALSEWLPQASAGQPIVATLGVIEPRKNQRAAIRAIAALPDAALLCIGRIKDEEYHRKLRAESAAHGLESRVVFTGHVSDPWPTLAACNAFIFPSRSEGFGLAIAEAMALGVPVVAAAREGAQDLVIHRRTALAVDPDDTEGLTSSLAEILSNEELSRTLSRNARKYVSETCRWRNTVEQTSLIYTTVLQET